MRWVQPFGVSMFRSIERNQTWTQMAGLNRTVLVKDNDVEQAFRLLNRSAFRPPRSPQMERGALRMMSREGMLGIIRRTERFEKPYKQRNRIAFQTCRAIYDEDMDRKIAFLVRKNRKDPNPGLF